ncbi:hypothetical protein FACS1894219_09870 [Clostridia bacterium]|nr:hypothetical protein FACS1894219_09870 [Clostridia bacterium]
MQFTETCTEKLLYAETDDVEGTMKYKVLLCGILFCATLASCSKEANLTASDETTAITDITMPSESITSNPYTVPAPVTPVLPSIVENVSGEGWECSSICVHNSVSYGSENASYHTIMGTLTDYIGGEKFEAWRIETEQTSKLNATADCKWPDFTIINFIDYFNISRDDFERLYNKTIYYYVVDYDVDVLYSGDKQLIEQYYIDYKYENAAEMEYRQGVRNLKSDLYNFYMAEYYDVPSDEAYSEFIRSICPDDVIWAENNITGGDDSARLIGERFYSIPQFVEYFNVPRLTLEKLDEIMIINDYMYTIDIDKIYNEAEMFGELTASGVNIDAIDAKVIIPRR